MPDQSPATEPPDAAPRMVSRFEANLLRILRFLFQQLPPEEGHRLIFARMERPPCLSENAVHLVKDALAKGSVLRLVREGGYRRERFLRAGQPVFGRLWERSPVDELALSFSPRSLDFLIWLTAAVPGETKTPWAAPLKELTVGDMLLLFLTYQALREHKQGGPALRKIEAIERNPLIRLMFPDDFADEKLPEAPAYAEWMSGLGAAVLEALQPALERHWLDTERTKGQIRDWPVLLQRGRAELAVLEAYLGAADQAGRPDLARFLLGVLAKLLSHAEITPAFWTGGLQGSGPPRLADRLETQRVALALLQHARRFRQWTQRARSRGYLDEDYAASKFWLSEWERYNGEQVIERAEQVLQQLEPLRMGPGA